MNTTEVNKINELYKQIDSLTAENKSLKTQLGDQRVGSEILDRLTSIEEKLDPWIPGNVKKK